MAAFVIGSRREVLLVLDWEPQRIVMSHGDVIEQDGAARRDAFAWAQ